MSQSTPSPKTGFQGCPVLGVGLGLRSPLLEETLAGTDKIDWVEIAPENYMGKGGAAVRNLKRAFEVYPIIPHGVTMSLGSTDPWDHEFLTELKKFFQWIDPPWFSDHLCYGGINGIYFNDLMPLVRTPEAVDHIVKRIRFIQETFERPYLIENVSYYLEQPENTMTEHDFLAEILEKSDCGLLLDVNNIYVNAQNYNRDPYVYLNRIPLERVVQIHVAGHNHFPEGIVDTHGDAVCDGVWELLDWVLRRCNPCGVMIERDQNFPPFAELEQELLKVRQIWENANPNLAVCSREELLCR